MDRAQGTNLALTLMVFHCTPGPSHFLSLYLIHLWGCFAISSWYLFMSSTLLYPEHDPWCHFSLGLGKTAQRTPRFNLQPLHLRTGFSHFSIVSPELKSPK